MILMGKVYKRVKKEVDEEHDDEFLKRLEDLLKIPTTTTTATSSSATMPSPPANFDDFEGKSNKKANKREIEEEQEEEEEEDREDTLNMKRELAKTAPATRTETKEDECMIAKVEDRKQNNWQDDTKDDECYSNKDVLFGDETHTGTKKWRKAVKSVVAAAKTNKKNETEEQTCSPSIYRQIRKKMSNNVKFYIQQDSDDGGWIEVSKKMRIKMFRNAYNEAKKELVEEGNGEEDDEGEEEEEEEWIEMGSDRSQEDLFDAVVPDDYLRDLPSFYSSSSHAQFSRRRRPFFSRIMGGWSAAKRDNNKYWTSRIMEDPIRFFQYAPDHFRNNKTLVLAVVKRHGYLLQYVSPELQNDKKVVIAAVKSHNGHNGSNGKFAFEFASPKLKKDKDVRAVAFGYWYQRVKADVVHLIEAPDYVRGDKDFMLEVIQKSDGSAPVLDFATQELQNNRDVVVTAVEKHGRAIKHASPALRNDKKLTMLAVQQDGYLLSHVSPRLQHDKEVLLAAVKQNPDAIRYITGGLKRDRDILIAAGMFDENHQTMSKEDLGNVKKVVLSTRFSLNKTSYSKATNFTKLFKEHVFIQQPGEFKIYAPNAFDKKTCDPEWTSFEHPCRGTDHTCRFNSNHNKNNSVFDFRPYNYNKNVLTKDGRPTDDCCWRYSFRYQLEEAKSTNGFMLQLVEKETWNSDEPKLGNGQAIELDMAENHLQMKVFHVYRPTDKYGYEASFKDCHVDEVVSAIKEWYDNDCHDMSLCVIHPTYRAI